MTAQLLEDLVFSKPYFDKEGLTIAESDDGRIIGFSHAAFGPNEDHSDVDTEVGVTCLTMVSPEVEMSSTFAALLEKSEEYLASRGAKLMYAGSVYPLNPFYLGFYGGSELPGVVASDADVLDAYLEAGYQEVDRCIIMACDLESFRPPVDRQQMQVKRIASVRRRAVPPSPTWWEACTRPPTEATIFEVVCSTSGELFGSVMFWMIEPLSTSRGMAIAGLTRLNIVESRRRQGLATYLNAESLKALRDAGIKRVEVQTMQNNASAIGLYRKLGFEEVDAGIILRKNG